MPEYGVGDRAGEVGGKIECRRRLSRESEFTKAVGLRGNDSDPFMNCLLAMTHGKLGLPATE